MTYLFQIRSGALVATLWVPTKGAKDVTVTYMDSCGNRIDDFTDGMMPVVNSLVSKIREYCNENELNLCTY